MFYKNQKIIVLVILLAALLTACNTAPEETEVPGTTEDSETATNGPGSFVPVISATGKVVPADWAALSFQTGGVVADVLVVEGEAVSQGDILIQLAGEEDALAAIAAAELAFTSAQQALDALSANSDVAAAQAQQTLKAAQLALDDALNSSTPAALALQEVANAQDALDTAERALGRQTTIATQADIDDAKAAVILTADALDNIRDDFEPWADKPEDNLTRATLQAKLSLAQQNYDEAVRRLNGYQSTGNAIDIAVAEADVVAAQAALADAERNYERLKDGPDAIEIALLEATVAAAQREADKYAAGSNAEEVALANARVANAQAQLAAAQAALDKLTLSAPFDGIISEIMIHTSEWIAPGQTAVLIADLNHLVVETTDLNEIDVARVTVGETAMITFDAVPSVTIIGTVTHIAPKSDEGAGVNYTVSLELAEIPAELRWGMTAFIDIETE